MCLLAFDKNGCPTTSCSTPTGKRHSRAGAARSERAILLQRLLAAAAKQPGDDGHGEPLLLPIIFGVPLSFSSQLVSGASISTVSRVLRRQLLLVSNPSGGFPSSAQASCSCHNDCSSAV